MIPIIDLSGDPEAVGAAIHQACCEHGFFYISGHGIDPKLQASLLELSRRFFALDDAEKSAIRMELGGRAWRGWFPVGGELTDGQSDWKEGIYFGSELPPDERPLHGPNLFPTALFELRPVVLAWMDALTRLGQMLMERIARGLRLPPDFFARGWMCDPTVLFRIFHYPPVANGWGVGEHTDYGVLTILLQDDVGGLEVKSGGRWIPAPPIPGTFVCNIGDMLDRMTGGLYRSTPHRVRNDSGRDRYSFPFFFDPGFDADIRRLPVVTQLHDNAHERWDQASVHAFEGTYGDYLIRKVSKVFPALATRL